MVGNIAKSSKGRHTKRSGKLEIRNGFYKPNEQMFYFNFKTNKEDDKRERGNEYME